MPWWTAWLWRQLPNGWKTSRPVKPAEPEVRPLGRQERAVGAVVEDDEGPQQEARRRNREGEGDPDRDVEAEVHGHGQRQVRQHRGGDVLEAVSQRGLLVALHRVPPIGAGRRRVGARRRSGWSRGGRHGWRKLDAPPAVDCRRSARMPASPSRWPSSVFKPGPRSSRYARGKRPAGIPARAVAVASMARWPPPAPGGAAPTRP